MTNWSSTANARCAGPSALPTWTSSLGTGIYVPVGSLALNNVRVTGNSGNAGGIHLSVGMLTLRDSRVDGNSGAGSGGIVVGAAATTTIVNSLISDNTASNFGGGIANYGSLVMVNSTVSGNSATRDGGGIYNASGGNTGLTHLYNVAVANNTAGSICRSSRGEKTIRTRDSYIKRRPRGPAFGATLR